MQIHLLISQQGDDCIKFIMRLRKGAIMTISNQHFEKKRLTIKSIPKSRKTINKQESIARQFRRIQKNYANLIQELIKEMDLVRGWLEKQALKKRTQFTAKLKTRDKKV